MAAVDIAYETGKPFKFRLPGSKKTWQLPNMADLPIGIKNTLANVAKPIEEARAAGREASPAELEAFGESQIKLFEHYCPGLLDEASPNALAAMLKAWAEHSGIDLGE